MSRFQGERIQRFHIQHGHRLDGQFATDRLPLNEFDGQRRQDIRDLEHKLQ